MKRIKKIMSFLMGIVIGTLLGGSFVYAVNVIMAREVTYTSTETSKTNVQDAVDELYEKAFIHVGGMEVPVLKDGMIPIKFGQDGKILKASVGGDWYDYYNMRWANAVSVTSGMRSKYQNASVDTEILEADILGYFVWIPRYRYKLWNAENGVSNEQEIKIEFERVGATKSNGTRNGEWLTHPAFTFGNQELKGFWVGKFELTGTTTTPTVKPNNLSLTSANSVTFFNMIRKFSTTNTYGLTSYDAHMMKNIEWGAVAYLSHSKYGKNGEVWINNTNSGTGVAGNGIQWGPSITGCSGASVSASVKNNMTACENGRDYKTGGVNASTTGNITGIYDMSGGAWEYIMANISDSSGNFQTSSSGFTSALESKYYDAYPTNTNESNFVIGKLGDATREMLKSKSGVNAAWYNDATYMAYNTSPWLIRGGYASTGSSAGFFRFDRGLGGGGTAYGCRAVLS